MVQAKLESSLPRVTPAKAETTDKAEAILSGAMQEFLKQGYAAASMDRVAKAAGVSKATVYSHFDDKEALFEALVQRLAQQKIMSVFGSEPLQGDPCVVLRRLADAALTQMMCDEDHRSFIRLIMGESGRFPKLAQVFVKHQAKPTIDLLSGYLASCTELNIPDPEATARILVGALIHYMQLQEMMHGKEIMPFERDRLLDSLMHLVFSTAKPATSTTKSTAK